MLAQLLSERAELNSAADYQRYRTRATRRAALLRQKSGLALKPSECGKKAPQNVTAAEHWTLAIWLAERAWATAQEMRAELAQSAGTSSRQKNRYISKLAKSKKLAASTAQAIESLGTEEALQALAYSHMAAGDLALQQNRWVVASSELARARIALEALITLLGSNNGSGSQADVSELTQYIAGRIDPSLRLALARSPDSANRKTDATQFAKKAVLEDDKQSVLVKAVLAVDAALLEAPSTAPIQELGQLSWRGRTITVRDADLAQSILNVQQAEKRLEAHSGAEEYDESLKGWQETIALCREILSVAESDEASAEAANELYVVLSYLQFSMLCRRIQRDCAVLNQSSLAELRSEMRARDAARVYDVVLQSCDELTDLRGVFNDEPLAAAVEQMSRTFRARRAAALAECYSQAGDHASALALLNYAQRQLQNNSYDGISSDDVREAEKLLPLGHEQFAETKSEISKLYSVAHGSAQLAACIARSKLPREEFVADDLDSFPSGTPEQILKHLIRPTLLFSPVMLKPVFYDLAFEMIRYSNEGDIA